jgi:UDP-glucose 4-epimerase
MKVLVSGGTGYIGSHTVVELLDAGYEVVIIDNLSNSKIEVLSAIEEITHKKPHFEKADMRNESQVVEVFEKHKNMDAVIHFAAFKAVGESVADPLKYYENNLASLIFLLRTMGKHGCNALVFSSSCTVYGQPDNLPISETAPVVPAESPYGNTKQICEEIIRDYLKIQENFKSISLRYFNPIGSHDSALIGELPLNAPTNLCPVITQTAIGKRPHFDVFGTDYNTPDGTCIRDYLHVVDLAKAHVLSIERMLENKNKSPFEVFNLGTGKGNSVLEVIEEFIKVSGVKPNYRLTERRPGDVEQIWADTTYANEELGWKTERDLANMLKTAWEWELYLKKSEEKSA